LGGVNTSLVAMPSSSSVESLVQDAAVEYGSITDYIFSDLNVTMKIQGGQFDGKVLKLGAALGYYISEETYNSNDGDFEILFQFNMAINWGTDPYGNREYILFQFGFIYDDSIDGNATAYAKNYANNLVAQFNSGTAFIQGAIPELLYFYDFSAQNTVAALSTVPPVALTPSGNFAAYINQYDAGTAFGLPVDQGKAGGSSCGPLSLSLLLTSRNLANPGVATIFNNTMSGNKFDYKKAAAWLNGNKSYEQNPFPNPFSALLPAFSAPTSREPDDVARLWSQIDSLLSKHQPVLIRTSLTCCPSQTHEGGGHDILLLGKGNSANVAQLYNTSGDYYIVCDPAGHYFGDTNTGKHYGKVSTLSANAEGINYGGWLSMYPVGFLQTHVHSNQNPNSSPRLNAVTIGFPFAPMLVAAAHSPVTLTVTDPFGNQTGILTNGTVVSNIPQAIYDPPWQDEDDGTSSIDPDGPKTVVIENPIGGTYTITVIGTNSGPYTLDWTEFQADGTVLSSNTYTGTAFAGMQQAYSVNVIPIGPPSINLSMQGQQLMLAWPSVYTGYLIQMTTNLANVNAWAPCTNSIITISNLNAINIPISSTKQFFRLIR